MRDQEQEAWRAAAPSPVWKAVVQPRGSATAIDQLVSDLRAPERAYREVSRDQGVALVRDYLIFDPVYRRPRLTRDDAAAWVSQFVSFFTDAATFWVDDDVAAHGIAAARAAWGMSLIAADAERTGGIWLADED